MCIHVYIKMPEIYFLTFETENLETQNNSLSIGLLQEDLDETARWIYS